MDSLDENIFNVDNNLNDDDDDDDGNDNEG